MTHWIPSRRPRKRAQLGLVFDATQPPKPTKVQGTAPRETEIQRDIMRALQLHPAVAMVYRINTRVLDVDDRKSSTGKRPLRTAPTGHPDIIAVLRGGRAMYVEVKTAKGTLSDAQAAFLTKANKAGALGVVARSVDDVLAVLPSIRETRSAGLDIV